MKIDSAIKEFTEKYDFDAISSIDSISREIGLVKKGVRIKAFNIQESFDAFNDELKGVAGYVIKYKNDPMMSSLSKITETVNKFIDTTLFQECDVKYADLPDFVRSYVTGIKQIIETVDLAKSEMMDADIDPEIIGTMNEYVDRFMDKLTESFDPTMDRILWASGYNSRKRIFGEKKAKPVFL